MPHVLSLLLLVALAASHSQAESTSAQQDGSRSPTDTVGDGSLSLCIFNDVPWHNEVLLSLVHTFAPDYGPRLLVRATSSTQRGARSAPAEARQARRPTPLFLASP